MPIVSCKTCGKEFYAKPSHIKMGYCKYCSRSCWAISRKTGRYVTCFTCQKETWKTPKALKSSKSGKYFCSKKCQTVWRNKYYSGKKHPNWKGGYFREYRDILKNTDREKICIKCGNKDYRVLAVHHLDRDRCNHKKSNLVYLCMNCHYLVHRYNEKIC